LQLLVVGCVLIGLYATTITVYTLVVFHWDYPTLETRQKALEDAGDRISFLEAPATELAGYDITGCTPAIVALLAFTLAWNYQRCLMRARGRLKCEGNPWALVPVPPGIKSTLIHIGILGTLISLVLTSVTFKETPTDSSASANEIEGLRQQTQPFVTNLLAGAVSTIAGMVAAFFLAAPINFLHARYLGRPSSPNGSAGVRTARVPVTIDVDYERLADEIVKKLPQAIAETIGPLLNGMVGSLSAAGTTLGVKLDLLGGKLDALGIKIDRLDGSITAHQSTLSVNCQKLTDLKNSVDRLITSLPKQELANLVRELQAGGGSLQSLVKEIRGLASAVDASSPIARRLNDLGDRVDVLAGLLGGKNLRSRLFLLVGTIVVGIIAVLLYSVISLLRN
jgi:hypothetical protein